MGMTRNTCQAHFCVELRGLPRYIGETERSLSTRLNDMHLTASSVGHTCRSTINILAAYKWISTIKMSSIHEGINKSCDLAAGQCHMTSNIRWHITTTRKKGHECMPESFGKFIFCCEFQFNSCFSSYIIQSDLYWDFTRTLASWKYYEYHTLVV